MKTRNEIITDALRKCGALGEKETATTEQFNTGASALNALIKAFAVDGMQIWKIEQVVEPFSSFTTSAAVSVGVGKTIVTTSAPLKLIGAWRQLTASELKTPLEIYTRQEYMDIPDPAAEGAPLAVYYQPLKTDGSLYLWPIPDSTWQTDGQLVLDFQVQYTATTTGTDVLDFPDHWEQTLIYSLAQRLAPEYGVSINERNLLTQDSERFRQEALFFSNEEGSIFLRPTMRR